MPNQLENSAEKVYQIKVRGHLDQSWSAWFDGFKFHYDGSYTNLIGPVVDQSALHGVLSKIRDLGLSIQLVENLSKEDGNNEMP